MPLKLNPITAEWVGAVYTPEDARSQKQRAWLSFSDSLIAELNEADEYIVGLPMHNCGVLLGLKLWLTRSRVSA